MSLGYQPSLLPHRDAWKEIQADLPLTAALGLVYVDCRALAHRLGERASHCAKVGVGSAGLGSWTNK